MLRLSLINRKVSSLQVPEATLPPSRPGRLLVAAALVSTVRV